MSWSGAVPALVALSLFVTKAFGGVTQTPEGCPAYLASDLRIPFWNILRWGIEFRGLALGCEVAVYSAENDPKRELEAAVRAIGDRVNGILLSPTDSSAAVTVLKPASEVRIPVVIADMGPDRDDYVSYISSDNYGGAYRLDEALVPALKGPLLRAGAQQPLLMGEKAVDAMGAHLKGEQPPEQVLLPVLAIAKENVDRELPHIRRNLPGIVEE
jgi:ABC-type sugar transport system substrate-binding protein